MLTMGTVNKAGAQTTVETKTKKGWSKKAKGAVIGTAAGAGVGALVSPNHRGRGAVVGAAVGAGSGYLYGRHRDKKHPSRKYKTKTTTTYR